MYWYSEGDLIGEIIKFRRYGALWFWYRDVLLQAQERGFVKITAHTDDKPFWWRKFGESIEIVNEKLKEKIAEDDKEHGAI
jgi:hypothetical protein